MEDDTLIKRIYHLMVRFIKLTNANARELNSDKFQSCDFSPLENYINRYNNNKAFNFNRFH